MNTGASPFRTAILRFVQAWGPGFLFLIKVLGKAIGYMLTAVAVSLLSLMLYSWFFVIVKYYFQSNPDKLLNVFAMGVIGLLFGFLIAFNYALASFGSPGFTTEHRVLPLFILSQRGPLDFRREVRSCSRTLRCRKYSNHADPGTKR